MAFGRGRGIDRTTTMAPRLAGSLHVCAQQHLICSEFDVEFRIETNSSERYIASVPYT